MDDQLHTFVKQALDQGQTVEQIREELLSVGWDEEQVRTAISDVMSSPMIVRGFNPIGDQYPLQNVTTQTQPIQQNGSYTPVASSVAMSGQRVEDPRHPQIVRKYGPMSMALGVALLLAGVGVVGGTSYYFISQPSGVSTQARNPVQENPPVNADIPFTQYRNDEYSFYMNLPRGWSVKEYPMGTYGQEKRIAFGETGELPQNVFVQGNYAWIKIFPVSDTSNYNNFIELEKVVGTDEKVRPYRLDGKMGVLHKDFVTVEYKESVYELHLPTGSENGDYESFTTEAKEIISSFRFL